MKTFTGWQYLLIDAANAFGLDKEIFEKRIEWTTAHLDTLESLADQADNKALFVKATQAIRKAQAGKPTGHIIGFDAVCSGMQIMSAITGCVSGAKATGLIDTGVRPDAYNTVTQAMNVLLGNMHQPDRLKITAADFTTPLAPGLTVSRAAAKQAVMTSLYGSKAEPKKLFGEDTPELEAFYAAMLEVAPGAWGLLQVLLSAWQPWALSHDWKLPDGFDAHIKVMQKFECRIEVDELDHSTFTYAYQDNAGTERGISLAANVVHSIDAYVLRSIHRRCNYDRAMVEFADHHVQAELLERNLHGTTAQDDVMLIPHDLHYHMTLWEKTGMVDAVILPYLDADTVKHVTTKHLLGLAKLMQSMLAYQPFAVVAIHDEFKCGPNHMNHLREQYRQVLADLADSTILDYILTCIHRKPCSFLKRSNGLSHQILQSNYALC